MMSATLLLPHEIGPGPEREVQILLADHWRKLVLIQLRRGALLADHTARVPITIQTVAGKGILRLGRDAQVLSPGVLVPVDAHILHNVQGDPDVAILVSFFRQAEAHDERDSTAQFD
jgi:quercetin dioxygenase-like cupin family protein